MAESLSIQQAVRFLERVYGIAAQEGKAGSLTNWISVKDANDYNRALRRGVCLTAIRAVNDDPKHDIFSTFPGATDDLYYKAALDAFLPAIRMRAQSDALKTLDSQASTIDSIKRQVRDPQIARRLNGNAVKIQKVGSVLDLPVTDKARLPELTADEVKQIVNSQASGTVLSRLKRTIYMREARRSSDSTLLLLMAPPNGVAIVNAFAKNAAEGQRVAGETLDACNDAVVDMQISLNKVADYIWKFPPALGTGSTRLANEVGR